MESFVISVSLGTGCYRHIQISANATLYKLHQAILKAFEFEEVVPKGKAKGSSAAQGLAYCTLLFEIEKGLEDLAPERRYNQRLKQAKPVLDAFLAWANVRQAAPQSALGKALNYVKEQWPYLCNYLILIFNKKL